jgi:hypothetical protein
MNDGKQSSDRGHARNRRLAFLAMVLSCVLMLVSISLLLEGKSLLGRMWIVVTVVGLWLLLTSTAIWADGWRGGKREARGEGRGGSEIHSDLPRPSPLTPHPSFQGKSRMIVSPRVTSVPSSK